MLPSYFDDDFHYPKILSYNLKIRIMPPCIKIHQIYQRLMKFLKKCLRMRASS